MTARGRQYYDPEIQTTRFVPGLEDLNRIEIYPVGPESTARLPQEIGKWAARRVDGQGGIVDQGASDTQQERTIDLARERWPGLEVYVLGAEIEDSTWEGVGPSPRLWRHADHAQTLPPAVDRDEIIERIADGVQEHGPRVLRAIVATDPGSYVHINDIVLVLEEYAQQYDEQGNPSGALALREAAAALAEPF